MQAPAEPLGPRRSSPLVRRIAREQGVDLSRVAGTGLAGRITRRDIEAFLDTPGAMLTPPVIGMGMGMGMGVGAPREPAHLEFGRLETKTTGGAETLDGVPVRRERMTKMRTLIAEHMARSVRTSPHVTTIFEIDMHRIIATRERLKQQFAEREGFNLTFSHFITWAAVQAIKKHPVVNVSVDGEDILWKDQINVGVAVAIQTGLIVPVIKDAGDLDVLGIARRLNDLATRARSKRLTPEDVQGGTFSITNPGVWGSIVSSPIINQPQVAILSVGAIVKRPAVVDDQITVRPLCQIGLTFDHRVVDGEGGATYLATLKELLETFDKPVL
jgi:pyruvate/2-oxoglutarate dehydrogenase complex dihydrolipoamide acyltransferase (E2) component